MSKIAKVAAPVAAGKLAKQVLGSGSPGLLNQMGPVIEGARERVLPALEHAREQVGPTLEIARERITPTVELAREQLRETVTPALAEALETARERSAPARREAVRRSEVALAALVGQPVTIGRRRRWPLALFSLLAGFSLGAAVGYLTRRSQQHELPGPAPYTPAGNGSDTVPNAVAAPMPPQVPNT